MFAESPSIVVFGDPLLLPCPRFRGRLLLATRGRVTEQPTLKWINPSRRIHQRLLHLICRKTFLCAVISALLYLQGFGENLHQLTLSSH